MAGARKEAPCSWNFERSNFLGSDSVALAPFTKKIIYLDEGDSVFIKKKSYEIYNENFKKVKRSIKHSSYTK